MNKVILASASPRRRELLTQIGMEYEVIPALSEEKLPLRKAGGSLGCAGDCRDGERELLPSEIVELLSAQKAGEVLERLLKEKRSFFTVIGADTVVALDGVVMGKPGSRQEAISMLTRLQGRSHQVYTGVTLIAQNGENEPPLQVIFHEKTDVVMYPMSEAEINAYVDTGEPMDKAGAYGIQGRCAAFIREIHGDYNNVVGLPVGRVYQELKGMGRKR
ncbi:MAG: septum formation protein Maf [Lachnospiraceae bacterium]|mgnify:CR=1 FL=1|nr:septum formation protein Maf [Lachnospiraceae bacterium]